MHNRVYFCQVCSQDSPLNISVAFENKTHLMNAEKKQSLSDDEQADATA